MLFHAVSVDSALILGRAIVQGALLIVALVLWISTLQLSQVGMLFRHFRVLHKRALPSLLTWHQRVVGAVAVPKSLGDAQLRLRK